MLTLDDITAQLSRLFGGGGTDQGNGVTTFGASSGIPDFSNSANTTGISVPQVGTGAASSGLGLNLGTAGLALGGLQSLNSLIQGNKAFKLANDQFKFQKQMANANLNNSIQSYNNSLEDRLNARGFTEGRSAADTAADIERKRLSR